MSLFSRSKRVRVTDGPKHTLPAIHHGDNGDMAIVTVQGDDKATCVPKEELRPPRKIKRR